MPYPRILYVSQEHSKSGWHEWDHARNEPIVVEHPALTGRLVGAVEVERIRNNVPTPKLNLHVAADGERFVVESGIDTEFATSVLSALTEIDELENLLTIAVRPGDTKAVVFAVVFDAHDRRVKAPDDLEGVDSRTLLAEVARRLQGAGARAPQDRADERTTETPPGAYPSRPALAPKSPSDEATGGWRGLTGFGLTGLLSRLGVGSLQEATDDQLAAARRLADDPDEAVRLEARGFLWEFRGAWRKEPAEGRRQVAVAWLARANKHFRTSPTALGYIEEQIAAIEDLPGAHDMSHRQR